jgi:ribulose-5-phosphate 4-epimerase/fuculose-1-phosphate aldolase
VSLPSVLDAYGHLSVRHPHHPDRFFMSRYIAPATIASERDLVEYYISNAEPVDPNSPKGYSERCIHSEILKRFPEVDAVVHSHSEAVVPYSVSGVGFRAVYHMAGFLGTGVPVWDIGECYEEGERRDMLVSNQRLGGALATSFGSQEGGQAEHAVVLMRGHGFTVQGGSIMEVVLRAVYTQQNAGILTTALLARAAAFGGGGGVRGGAASGQRAEAGGDEGGILYLSEEETEGATEMTKWAAGRPWRLWLREVEAQGLYVNMA